MPIVISRVITKTWFKMCNLQGGGGKEENDTICTI